MPMFQPLDPRRVVKRRARLTAADGQKPGAHCITRERILNRAERRATGWRGPLPEHFAELRTRKRRRVHASESSVRAKLERLARRIGA